MNSSPESEASPRLGSRQAPRSHVRVKIDARNGQKRVSVLLVDLSISGVRLHALSPLKVGDTYWVKLPTMEPRYVTVRWSEGFVAGCEFDQPLAPYVLEHVLKTLPAAQNAINDWRFIPRI